jgi:signal transduction histidine kinase
LNLFYERLDILATGVSECLKKASLQESDRHVDVDKFLNGMLSSRIARRVMAEQHVALHKPPNPDHSGIINRRLVVSKSFSHAASVAQDLCVRTYGTCPEVVLEGDLQAHVVYIPYHLEIVLREILKNSMRATVEHHRSQRKEGPLPSIKAMIVTGPTELTIRISDVGGGIPKGNPIFKYGFTTATLDPDDYYRSSQHGVGQTFAEASQTTKMHGYGFGLPLSKLYLEYLGGSLDLKSLEGYGTDTYITLARGIPDVKL